MSDSVDCGDHTANTCFECPQGNGSASCNGDCTWDSYNSFCYDKDCRSEHSVSECVLKYLVRDWHLVKTFPSISQYKWLFVNGFLLEIIYSAILVVLVFLGYSLLCKH